MLFVKDNFTFFSTISTIIQICISFVVGWICNDNKVEIGDDMIILQDMDLDDDLKKMVGS